MKKSETAPAVDQAHGAKLKTTGPAGRAPRLGGLRGRCARPQARGCRWDAAGCVAGGVGPAFDDVAQVDAPGFVDGDARKKSCRLVSSTCTLGRCPGRWPRSGRAGSGSSRPAVPRPPALRSWGWRRRAVGRRSSMAASPAAQAGPLVVCANATFGPESPIGAQQFNGQLAGQVAVQCVPGRRVASSLPGWPGLQASVPR